MNLKEAKEFTIWMVGWFVVCSFAGMFINALITSVDDTDAGRFERSGLKLRTDYGTGCQYLEAHGGGLTPRMSGEKHVGCMPSGVRHAREN
jgi:hypothetical protein